MDWPADITRFIRGKYIGMPIPIHDKMNWLANSLVAGTG
jgi:hypothetical protein